jgi:hypothetical protein
VQQGDELVLRILRIDAFRHRISLSLKRVYPQEEEENLIQEARTQSVETDEASAPSSGNEERPSVESERAVEESSLEASPASLEPPDDAMLWSSLPEEEEAGQA